MRPLSPSRLLDAWEAGLALPRPERVLPLLSAADPDTPAATLAVGARDDRLLTLRELTFGPQVVCVAACPGCGESIELAFRVAEVRVPAAGEVPDALSVTVDGYEVAFRLPTSHDLAALADADVDVAEGGRLLLERCVLDAHRAGERCPPGDVPDVVLTAVVARMAEADPQADVELALSCPGCGREWEATFDVADFFWTEVDAWARRTLQTVHVLARAYGWRQDDVLALGPSRRELYLELAGG